jgi:hypothetical protein
MSSNKVLFRIPEHLKLIASGSALHELEGRQRHPVAE